MRAAVLHEIGGTPRLGDVSEPSGDNVVDVSLAGLNPVDVATANGTFHGGTPEVPYVVGTEAVGRTADGRHVWFRSRATVAEKAVADPQWTFDIPEGVHDSFALCCGVAGLTGWLAVSWRAAVTPEDTVLVLGASGTVGLAAVQGAKLLGAKTVVGAARRSAAVPEADEMVSLEGDYELPRATVVVDALWGEPAEKALAAAAPGARYVQLGQSAGATATVRSAWVRGKVLDILGFSLFATPSDVAEAGFKELCEHTREGKVRFDFETLELFKINEAWQRVASGSPRSKILVQVWD